MACHVTLRLGVIHAIEGLYAFAAVLGFNHKTRKVCHRYHRQVHRAWLSPTKSHLDGRASRSHHVALHLRRRNGLLAMNSDAASFIGNIPEHYDSGLGPMIFVDYAADIARRAAACSPARVLETAAGTGIVTRQLRDVLPPGVHLTATDLNAPMLEVAR